MTISIYAPGQLTDPDAYLLHAPASGLLQEWLVEEGDSVAAGQLLASVQSTNSDLNRENARIRMREVEQNLQSGSSFRQDLQIIVDNAKLKYDDDSANFARQQRLWNNNVGTKNEVESRELALNVSRKLYQSTLEQEKLRLKQLRNELQTSRNLLEIARNQSLDFQVSSKIKGVLAEQLVNAGEWVAPQQAIGRMGGLGEFILELEVDELDIVKIEVGQFVAISLDAYPGEVFPGRVSFLNTRKEGLTQSYRIEVVFEKKPNRWFEGMTAEANIVIQEKKQALLIPQSYLVGDRKVINAKGDTLELEIGESDLEYVEVLKGIDLKTELKKPGA
jgi:multidrug efflux pump subunit AcrA (membrane-fusion protein)